MVAGQHHALIHPSRKQNRAPRRTAGAWHAGSDRPKPPPHPRSRCANRCTAAHTSGSCAQNANRKDASIYGGGDCRRWCWMQTPASFLPSPSSLSASPSTMGNRRCPMTFVAKAWHRRSPRLRAVLRRMVFRQAPAQVQQGCAAAGGVLAGSRCGKCSSCVGATSPRVKSTEALSCVRARHQSHLHVGLAPPGGRHTQLGTGQALHGRSPSSWPVAARHTVRAMAQRLWGLSNTTASIPPCATDSACAKPTCSSCKGCCPQTAW